MHHVVVFVGYSTIITTNVILSVKPIIKKHQIRNREKDIVSH